MIGWECAIDDCGVDFGSPEELIAHQETEHAGHECRVCGKRVADGYRAISHAFSEHTRAEYVRAYDANAGAIRVREEVLRTVESALDEPVSVANETE